MSLFKIKRQIKILIYKLKLLSIMYIHLIILIAQLKSTLREDNSYKQQVNLKSLSVLNKNDNVSLYKIERLLNK